MEGIFLDGAGVRLMQHPIRMRHSSVPARDDAPQPSISVATIGNERRRVVVVENFSPHPERLVDEAASLTFERMGEFYPGARARVSATYYQGLGGVLNAVLREVYGWTQSAHFDRCLYSLATTPSDRLSLAQRIPHVDGFEAGMVAIVHYLCRENFGGTAFYRHRSTGFETVDASRDQDYLNALRRDFGRYGEPSSAYISGDTPIFEKVAGFEPAYNRALIYPSNLLHCASLPNGVQFPADPRCGRLTVTSFLSAR